jgi:hypothetical protein
MRKPENDGVSGICVSLSMCLYLLGISAAHIAAYYGQRKVLEFLSRANIKYLFEEADDGSTPAHHAAAVGRIGEEKIQLRCGA